MAAEKICDGVYSVGALNPGLRVFDIVMATDYGTSYNSYLVTGEKNALIETCHGRHFEFFLRNIREVIEPEKLDYIILNHCEPDHSGALAGLVELAPQAQVIVSQAGSLYLKNITNLALNMRVVKNGEKLDLGAGKELEFLNAPFLHWPDSMFTWLPSEKVLFSCDFLGCHYCEPNVYDSNITYPDKYEDAFRGYYDAIFGPFKPYVLAGLEKIRDLDIEFVATSHGPVLTKGCRIEYAMERYLEWSQPKRDAFKTIPIFYTSAYGNTEQIAKAIQSGVREVLPDAVCETFDMIEYSMPTLHEILNGSDAFAVGSPTINRDAVPPTWELLSGVCAITNAKKPALAFGSYGWSGEAVPNILGRFANLKLKTFGEGFKVCFVPTGEDLAKAKELGKEFAKSL